MHLRPQWPRLVGMAQGTKKPAKDPTGYRGYSEYDFLDKPMDGYPPGTTFNIDGQEIPVTGPTADEQKSSSSSSSRSRA